MKGFVLDTNCFIAADRNAAEAERLKAFYLRHLGATHLHAVVAQELLAGGVGHGHVERLREQYVTPFVARRRLVTPGFGAWARSGEIVAALVERSVLSRGGVPRSFANDAVLAASCREHGLTLVTSNLADFERIRTVLDFDFAPPWPGV